MDNVEMVVSCGDPGATLAVLFVSYGTPGGACPSFSQGACSAANSTAVVSAACSGQHSCTVYPNTTTFGDPCFGTVKHLAAVFQCSAGSGTATCATPPPPPPGPQPTLPNFTAAITVDFAAPTGATLKVEPSIQVVSQARLFRDAPQHDQAWATLAQLGARKVRFVPWLTYGAVGVGALMPPSVGHVCGPQNWGGSGGQRGDPVTLSCGLSGGAIESIDFASFGTPKGACGGYAVNAACHAANSTAVVAALCVGEAACTVPTAAGGPFGTPCGGPLWLAVQAKCTNNVTIAYWNLTLADAFFTDFWDAVDGNSTDPIPNFSTQPAWLYGGDYTWNNNPDQPDDYCRGPAAACDNALLGAYYGRLWSYFKKGFMVDEAGVTHTRPGPPMDIRTIEVFNEVDYEHGYDPETYTAAFDAVVRGVRTFADPDKNIKFVGLNLPNIDSGKKVAAWATYFLTASNHAPDVADALDFIGYHAYPTNGGYSRDDPSTFSKMFDYADTFIEQTVLPVDAIIAALSPGTRTVLDETGADMDNVLGPGSPPDNNARYWVAAAGYWAYTFARAANESATVVQCGASQLMDAPGQEPSVSLLDWETGLGTARFWAVRLLVEELVLGDATVATTSVSTGAGASSNEVHALGFAGGGRKKLLLINKRNAWVEVQVAGAVCTQLRVIDEFNQLSPARDATCAGGGFVLAPFATAVASFE
jgi:hypothetical protein